MKKKINPLHLVALIGIVLVIIVSGIMANGNIGQKEVKTRSINEFTSDISNMKNAEMQLTQDGGSYNISYEVKGNDKEKFKIQLPKSDIYVGQLQKAAADNNLTLNYSVEQANFAQGFGSLLMSLLPLIILMGLLWFMMRGMMGQQGKALEFGSNKARLQKGGTTTFNNVAGYEEEKQELQEVVDFLKNPDKYKKFGVRIPKGVLLVGPPGTGKTLLARATAGEAGVNFYTISGSEFLEMFVGVGASRVRSMFKDAKKDAPAIIFIDEIDAVGRQRGAGMGGGNDEREQTLNQLLVEMDGFDTNTNIVIMAATNRPDVLDPALLRPGRFDRQITVSAPDVKGREEILKLHSKNKPLAAEVNLRFIAERTPGFTGADIENLLNEAGLLAARENRPQILMEDIDEALDRVIAGPAKKSKKYSEREKRIVAYHEAGHAVIGLKLNDASIVHKVTIIPRGQAGGYALMMPREERFLSTKTELLDRIVGLLGGRVSEEIVFNEVTTGAHNDFEQATAIARGMVTEYGMSGLGPIQYEKPEGSVFLGRDYTSSRRNFSDQIALEIDQEIRGIISSAYKRCGEILMQNRDLLDLIAEKLIQYETLTNEQIVHLEKYGTMPSEVAVPIAQAAEPQFS